ncbi:GTP cyclohydrolase I FolE [uncultured Thalassolituus sp.]|uniref:GTP cyclohydrolase I FolE n=1 Tax=uncultured Thalassolituus sp. TaxID=285273 RepID=UPI00262F9A35|nr:GTP cyclohydrolase I FolE [uncultured Thalassolituus sp.]
MSKLESLYQEVLAELGEDTSREGLLDTPKRAAKAMQFLTSGYTTDIKEVINGAVFTSENDEMVVVQGIEFYSLCEHHLLPFFGKAHIAYIPDGHILGLSKFARLAEIYARRLQTQERLTEQIAQAVWETTTPQGVAVVIEASHLCMMMRGVQKQNSKTITSAMRGVFLDDQRTRDEFLGLIK